MGAFEYRQAEEVRDTFARHGCPDEIAEVQRGKDFIQLKNGPFDLDLIFAPDGFERFRDAWSRRVDIEGFPVCHIDDIIRSKEAARRQKDIESLPRLRAFRDYWIAGRAR